jgi:opacity protein-like surface antigen
MVEPCRIGGVGFVTRGRLGLQNLRRDYNMRAVKFALLGLALLVAMPLLAQDKSLVDVDGTYTVTRVTAGGPPEYFHGGNGGLVYNLGDYWGIAGDFGGGHDGDKFFSGSTVTYLGGLKLHTNTKWDLFGEGLLGGAHISITPTGGTNVSRNAFAWKLGGGLDYSVTPSVSLRLFQVDYLGTHFGGKFSKNDTQNNLQASVGIVFHFGSRK